MFLFNLLEESGSTTTNAKTQPSWWIWVILGVFLVGWIVMSYFTNKKRKAQADAEAAKRNNIKPGFTVTTIGGIVGTVVSVDEESNTFVLQTGDEERPSLLKFDKLAIYNSVDPDENKKEPVSEEQASETPSDEVFSEAEAEKPAEEAPVEEVASEEKKDKE